MWIRSAPRHVCTTARVDLDRKLSPVPCALAVSIAAFASNTYALNGPPSQVGRLTFTPRISTAMAAGATTARYGNVLTPRSVPSGWQPYKDGSLSGALGWTIDDHPRLMRHAIFSRSSFSNMTKPRTAHRSAPRQIPTKLRGPHLGPAHGCDISMSMSMSMSMSNDTRIILMDFDLAQMPGGG